MDQIAQCLRKPPYIRFHNQKAERLLCWREQGQDHVESILNLSSPQEKREYLIKNIKGMNYKEATHYLRNIGLSGDLVILDRHIINFMKELTLLPQSADMSQLSKKYKEWESLFYRFINSPLWIDSIGCSTIPRADFTIWAASVKKADSSISLDRIMYLK